MTSPLIVGYIGNFEPEHSTENHVRQALEACGHHVVPLQEGLDAWDTLACVPGWTEQPDLVLWTRTADLDAQVADDTKLRIMAGLRSAGIPIVGYHLDRWWGLRRQRELTGRLSPFFTADLVVTADGDHDDQWKHIGVNHHWMPPAVSEFECGGGTPRPEYTSDIAFVGSWQSYHPEWRHRMQLVDHLTKVWGERIKFWPRPGEHAVRNQPLRDLYASVKVVVGDSCLLPGIDGRTMRRYWSDRIPETTGRGAFLIHPRTEDDTALKDAYPDLDTWLIGDWMALDIKIENALASDEWRTGNALTNRDRTLEAHTYTVRMNQLVDELTTRGML